jgi:hypothetical protein
MNVKHILSTGLARQQALVKASCNYYYYYIIPCPCCTPAFHLASQQNVPDGPWQVLYEVSSSCPLLELLSFLGVQEPETSSGITLLRLKF